MNGTFGQFYQTTMIALRNKGWGNPCDFVGMRPELVDAIYEGWQLFKHDTTITLATAAERMADRLDELA